MAGGWEKGTSSICGGAGRRTLTVGGAGSGWTKWGGLGLGRKSDGAQTRGPVGRGLPWGVALPYSEAT